MIGSGRSVRGPHDIGGLEGFGPIPRYEDHQAWHESVMRMLFALALLGLVRTSGEVRYFVETLAPEEYRARSYYERWLAAIEALLERARQADVDTLAEAAAAPSAAALGMGDQPRPETSSPYVQAQGHIGVGSVVTARRTAPPGHNRLPMYVRGRRGVVRAMYPPQEVPGSPYAALRLEPVYSVAFSASELWNVDKALDEVVIDLFASYLE